MSRKSILITGCSSGIGLSCARVMRDRGWQVIATVRTAEDAARLSAEGLAAPLLDYADPQSIATAWEETMDLTGGTLDALFNNGAYAVPGAVEDLPREALRAIFEANVFGWHDLTRRAIPVMRRQGHGRIIQNSSVLGFAALRWRGAYVATKFALEGLTDTMRLELSDTPIHVSLIEPGPVTSRIRANSIPHFEKWIDWKASARKDQYESELIQRLYVEGPKDRFELPPERVADKLIHACESPRPRPRYFVTTPTWIMAAVQRLLPSRARDAVARRV